MVRINLLFVFTLLLFLLGSGCTAQPSLVDVNAPPPAPDLDPYPWAYLRHDQPLAANEQLVSVIAVGDLLLGRGVTAVVDPLRHAAGWLEDADNGLSVRFRRLLNGLWEDLKRLDSRVAELNQEIAMIAKDEPAAQRLQQLRGVGPITATALVAAVGDARQFANGRQMSAALGLTPKQHSSGGKDRLLGISKRGDSYVRTLLIHGARAVIRTAKHKEDRLSQWVTALAQRSHPNVAAAALANKTARIAWAMLRKGTDYQPNHGSC